MDYILELQEKFKLPKGVIPVVLLTMGYSDQPVRIARKLSKEIVVHDEEYKDHSIEFIEREFFNKYGLPTMEMREDLKKQILRVVVEVDGLEASKEVADYLETQERVSVPMRYFGLHYVANKSASDNTSMLNALYENGFVWAKGENFPK